MGCTAALAADLTVKGAISAPSCTVANGGAGIGRSGIYNYGQISSAMVKPGTTTTPLSTVTVPWTVTCDAQTYLTFNIVDNRAGTASTPASTNFGLGNVNGSGKLGYYTVTLSNPTVDGALANTFSTTGTTFTAISSTLLSTGSARYGWASGNNTLKAGRVFAANLTAAPYLAGSATMGGAVTDGLSLDGSLTLNFALGL
jgi:hypothetical protein